MEIDCVLILQTLKNNITIWYYLFYMPHLWYLYSGGTVVKSSIAWITMWYYLFYVPHLWYLYSGRTVVKSSIAWYANSKCQFDKIDGLTTRKGTKVYVKSINNVSGINKYIGPSYCKRIAWFYIIYVFLPMTWHLLTYLNKNAQICHLLPPELTNHMFDYNPQFLVGILFLDL